LDKDERYSVSIGLPVGKDQHPRFYRCYRGEGFGEGWLEEDDGAFGMEIRGELVSFGHVVVLALVSVQL
jgi:hypothetical protein